MLLLLDRSIVDFSFIPALDAGTGLLPDAIALKRSDTEEQENRG